MTDRLLGHAREMRQNPTAPERLLWRALRRRRLGAAKFRRQAPIGPFIVDFFCAEWRLIVEVDGASHAEPGSDAARDAWLRARGSRILRVWNNEVMDNLDGVLAQITAARQTPSQSLT